MKQLKFAMAALMAILALTGILASTASAEATLPSILPAGTTSTSEGGKSTFGNKTESLSSPKSKGLQTENGKKLGTFDVLFEKVTNILSESCLGLNDKETGSVLVLGTYHVRDWKNNKSLIPVLTFLLQTVHLSCGTLLIIVQGCVAGSLSPIETLTKTLTVTLNEVKEDNEIITVLNDELTKEENCELKSSINEGEPKLSVEKTTQKLTGFKVGTGKEITVLVMPTP